MCTYELGAHCTHATELLFPLSLSNQSTDQSINRCPLRPETLRPMWSGGIRYASTRFCKTNNAQCITSKGKGKGKSHAALPRSDHRWTNQATPRPPPRPPFPSALDPTNQPTNQPTDWPTTHLTPTHPIPPGREHVCHRGLPRAEHAQHRVGAYLLLRLLPVQGACVRACLSLSVSLFVWLAGWQRECVSLAKPHSRASFTVSLIVWLAKKERGCVCVCASLVLLS